MHHLHMEHFAMIDSPVHRIDARVKVAVTVVYILIVAMAPVGWTTAAAAVFPVSLILLSRVPAIYLFKRLLVVLPFVLVVALFMPFMPGGRILMSFTVAGHSIGISEQGIRIFEQVLSRACLSVLALLALAATTRFSLILKAIHWMRVPPVIVLLLSFMYRYLFLLADQTVRMRRARDARLSRHKKQTVRNRFHVAAGMVGSLFLRTYCRAERIHAAMLARGFSSDIRTVAPWRFRWQDAVFLALSVGYLCCIVWLWKGTS
ncbi:MAG: cobalt ECF transporter T component CbiQ [Candidatus Hydrogenedentes bacterium]|nr:cobalt ECF transporter T component CbiQ [Candidatus Hydrogenedentota bacterium]